MPKTIFVDARWEGTIQLGQEVLDHVKKNNIQTVGLFASVQFLDLDGVRKQLEDAGVTVKTTKAKRTHVVGQILGCDSYKDAFQNDIISEVDMVLYIGDGLFHPKALLLAQTYTKQMKDVVIWDPVSVSMKVITKADVQEQINQTKKNLTLFVAAERVGILVTVKPGQQYLETAKRLRDKLEAEGKQAYIFIDNTVNLFHLENYPFIQAWVNTGCPRMGQDDLTTLTKPLINVREAFDPTKALEQL